MNDDQPTMVSGPGDSLEHPGTLDSLAASHSALLSAQLSASSSASLSQVLEYCEDVFSGYCRNAWDWHDPGFRYQLR